VICWFSKGAGERRLVTMTEGSAEKTVSQGLKITFLVHFVVGLFFGLVNLVVPEQWGDLTNWPVTDPVAFRLIGAAILGFATSSFLAYRETDWERVIIIVRAEIVWTALATLVFLVALLFGGAPAIGWFNAILMAGFCAAFSVFYRPA
jgi:hypothetical protein